MVAQISQLTADNCTYLQKQERRPPDDIPPGDPTIGDPR